jgi:hypothetical protein
MNRTLSRRISFFVVIFSMVGLFTFGDTTAYGEIKKKDPMKKFIGTWNEPYLIVGTRQIIKVSKKVDGTLQGTLSLPEVGTGNTFRVFSTKLHSFEIDKDDDDILIFKSGSPDGWLSKEITTYKLEFIEPGESKAAQAHLTHSVDGKVSKNVDEFVKQ